MSVKVNEKAAEILSAIKSAKKVLLHFHPSPDPDSIGGALAMAHILKSFGKDFTLISGDSELPDYIKAFPHSEWVTLSNYEDIKKYEFDLFIVLDSSTPDQISRIEKVTFALNMNVVVIDHHVTNFGFGKINLIDGDYPANCQLLYDLFTAWGVNIDCDIAICLFTGIYTDTGGFKYSGANFETLQVASNLAKINPDFAKIIFEIENNNDPKQIEFMGLALSSIEIYFSGNVSLACVPFSELEKHKLQKKDTAKMQISNILKSVVDWNIGASFVESEPGKVDVSLRTRHAKKFDLSRIAVAVGNGGGHKAAAGTTIVASFDEAKRILLDAIAKVYPQLGQP